MKIVEQEGEQEDDQRKLPTFRKKSKPQLIYCSTMRKHSILKKKTKIRMITCRFRVRRTPEKRNKEERKGERDLKRRWHAHPSRKVQLCARLEDTLEKVEELAKVGYEEGEFGLDTMGSDSPLISKVQGELVFNRRGPGQTSQVQYLKGSP